MESTDSQPLIAVYKNSELIGEFETYQEAVELTNLSYLTIKRLLVSGEVTVEGYSFKRPESYRPRETRITWYFVVGNGNDKFIRGYNNLKDYLKINSDKLTSILKTNRTCPDGRYIVKITNSYEIKNLEKIYGGIDVNKSMCSLRRNNNRRSV